MSPEPRQPRVGIALGAAGAEHTLVTDVEAELHRDVLGVTLVRVRDRVGARVRWYETPEEAGH